MKNIMIIKTIVEDKWIGDGIYKTIVKINNPENLVQYLRENKILFDLNKNFVSIWEDMYTTKYIIKDFNSKKINENLLYLLQYKDEIIIGDILPFIKANKGTYKGKNEKYYNMFKLRYNKLKNNKNMKLSYETIMGLLWIVENKIYSSDIDFKSMLMHDIEIFLKETKKKEN